MVNWSKECVSLECMYHIVFVFEQLFPLQLHDIGNVDL